MSKIHLLFDYKQDRNKYLILFVNNITDYAYKSKEFLLACKNAKEIFHSDESVSPDNLCQVLLNDIYSTIAEKEVNITYAVYVSMNDLIIYTHRYPHGRENDFICEKIMFLELDNKSKLSREDIIYIASVVLPARFKIKKDDKAADSILLSTEEGIFYDDEFLQSKNYEKAQAIQTNAINDIETKLGIKALNVFCIE